MGNSNHIIRASKPEETIRPQDIIFRSVTTGVTVNSFIY